MIKVHLNGGQIVEGVVFAIDPVTHAIILKNDTTFEVINADKIDLIEGEISESLSEDVPATAISQQALQQLEKQESRLLQSAEKKLSEMNSKVSSEVQNIFDRLNFIFPCSWSGESILVVDRVRINPPYSANEIEFLPGSAKDAFFFNRLVKALEGDVKKKSRR